MSLNHVFCMAEKATSKYVSTYGHVKGVMIFVQGKRKFRSAPSLTGKSCCVLINSAEHFLGKSNGFCVPGTFLFFAKMFWNTLILKWFRQCSESILLISKFLKSNCKIWLSTTTWSQWSMSEWLYRIFSDFGSISFRKHSQFKQYWIDFNRLCWKFLIRKILTNEFVTRNNPVNNPLLNYQK